jgi:uncharacterized protein (TIGR02996 family)
MNADHEPFLRAIAAAPDDDLPRLVYADWLDEHGHAGRAEFIRLDRDRRRGALTPRERQADDDRLCRLLARHGGPYDGAVWLVTGFQQCRHVAGRLTNRVFELRGPVTARVVFSASAHQGSVQVNGYLLCHGATILSLLGRQAYEFQLVLDGCHSTEARIVINFAFGLPLGTLAFYVADTLVYAEA